MNNAIIEVVEAIARDVKMLAQSVLKDYSLQDSSLYDTIKVEIKKVDEPIVLEILFDHYVEYIEQGRKPGSEKKPPVDALRNWALSRGIPADNATLWAISTAIQRDGIEGRPILAALEQKLEGYFEQEWVDKLFEAVMEKLMHYFN